MVPTPSEVDAFDYDPLMMNSSVASPLRPGQRPPAPRDRCAGGDPTRTAPQASGAASLPQDGIIPVSTQKPTTVAGRPTSSFRRAHTSSRADDLLCGRLSTIVSLWGIATTNAPMGPGTGTGTPTAGNIATPRSCPPAAMILARSRALGHSSCPLSSA